MKAFGSTLAGEADMPEGPEMHRAADSIRAAVAGDLVRVEFAWEHLADFEGVARSVTAHGKAVLIHFDDRVIYTHNQLWGRWYVRKQRSYPRTRRQLRLALCGPRAWALLYSASELEVLEVDEIHPYVAGLGPDLLAPRTTPAAVKKALLGTRRALGAVLLDQGVLAGPGNYLRSEILFDAGLLPDRVARELAPGELARLVRSCLLITRRAYEQKGRTTTGSERHYAYGRAGRPCPRCDTRIERTLYAGRQLFTCPGCQS